MEDCLVPKFKLSTINVWAGFKGNQKGPLIFWDKEWGKTTTAASFTTHIVLQFYRFLAGAISASVRLCLLTAR